MSSDGPSGPSGSSNNPPIRRKERHSQRDHRQRTADLNYAAFLRKQSLIEDRAWAPPTRLEGPYIVPPGPHLPTERPKDWISPAQRVPEEVLELIFDYVECIIMDEPLPEVTMRARDLSARPLNNDRLTNGEVAAIKKAMVIRTRFEYRGVCPNWEAEFDKPCCDVVIIGEREAMRVAENMGSRESGFSMAVPPHKLTITIMATLFSLHAILVSYAKAIHALTGDDPLTNPIPLRRLNILHSFEPEDLSSLPSTDLRSALEMFAPASLSYETFAGEQILYRPSLDTIARAANHPLGNFVPKLRFVVAVEQVLEERLLNVGGGVTGSAIVEEINTSLPRRDLGYEQRIEEINRKIGRSMIKSGGRVDRVNFDFDLEMGEETGMEGIIEKPGDGNGEIIKLNNGEKAYTPPTFRIGVWGSDQLSKLGIGLSAKQKAALESKDLTVPPQDDAGSSKRKRAESPLPSITSNSQVPVSQSTESRFDQTKRKRVDSPPREQLPLTLETTMLSLDSTYTPQPEVSSGKRKRTYADDDVGVGARKTQKIQEVSSEEDAGHGDSAPADTVEGQATKPNEQAEGNQEKSTLESKSENTITNNPWVLLTPESLSDPDFERDDRADRYISMMTSHYTQLANAKINVIGSDDHVRRTMWVALFGANTKLDEEFVVADRKWSEISNRILHPTGWNPSFGLRFDGKVPEGLITDMTKTWKHCLRELDIRGPWMNLFHDLRPLASHGVLSDLDYHLIPLSPGAFKKSIHHRRKPHRSPNPPVGATKSVDNALMWDFAERPTKWTRKTEKMMARDKGEIWDEQPRVRKLHWNLHIPAQIWQQEKDRVRFKGKGRSGPWIPKSNEDVFQAVGGFILEEGKKWEVPKNADDEEWDDRRCFNEILNFVINRSTRRTKSSYKSNPRNSVERNNKKPPFSITKGIPITDEWLADYITQRQRKYAVQFKREGEIWQDREESWWNDLSPQERRKKYNEEFVGVYLNQIGVDGRLKLLDKLKVKYGSSLFWEKVHWDLVHPAYPGVTMKVEERKR